MREYKFSQKNVTFQIYIYFYKLSTSVYNLFPLYNPPIVPYLNICLLLPSDGLAINSPSCMSTVSCDSPGSVPKSNSTWGRDLWISIVQGCQSLSHLHQLLDLCSASIKWKMSAINTVPITFTLKSSYKPLKALTSPLNLYKPLKAHTNS